MLTRTPQLHSQLSYRESRIIESQIILNRNTHFYEAKKKKKPKKNKKGNRYFTEKDIDNFKIIFHLVKERGYTLDGAKKKLRENKADTVNNVEIISQLQDIRAQLVAIREIL